MVIFISFHYVNFVNFALSLPMCYSINFTKKLYNDRKENFLAYIAASVYNVISKEVEHHIFRHS